MSRYIRTEIFETNIVADPRAVDRELRRAAESLNGSMDSLQIADSSIGSAELEAGAINYLQMNDSIFGGGGLILQRGDMISRDWTYPDGSDVTWLASDDGVIVGALDFTCRLYAQDAVARLTGWSMGVFMDGILIGRTERILTQYGCGSVPVFAVVTKGTHTFKFGVLTVASPASLATDTDDVIAIFPNQFWFRHCKR